MTAINRKQVPMCRTHHLQLHHNTLSAKDRELFAQGCKALARSVKTTHLDSK
jgi:hypothetical protein